MHQMTIIKQNSSTMSNSLTNNTNADTHPAFPFPTVPQKQETKQNRVRFATLATLHLYSDRLKDTWYNEQEYLSFRASIRSEVEIARETGPSFDDIKVSGIEHMVCQHTAYTMSRNRQLHRRAVLNEVRYQKMRGYSSPEKLQVVSEVYSTHSRVWTLRLAGGEV